jgi:rare lipoprotein A (peptidoglycan hydrolase)
VSPKPSFAVVLGLLVVVVACASSPKLQSPRTRPKVEVGTTATGTASWYGPGYDGKRTACGERFDQDGLTAAHGTYPCDTKVRVTLLSSGKSVVVRINDLFPNHKGRLIDVSRGAAKAIGLIGPGTGKVKVEVVK